MVQLGKDQFAIADRPLTVDDAVARLQARVPRVAEIESVDLFAAEGRILAEDLVAAIDLPNFDNAAVDGYALRATDLRAGSATNVPVIGRIAAGDPVSAPNPRGAIRIFTGAPLPSGYDTVAMQEDCRLDDDGSIFVPAGLAAGANCRKRGEDLARGALALAAGRRLAPEDIGLAAALGHARLDVRRRLRAAIFSTGDEIVAPGAPLPAAGVYDANRFMLAALMRRHGLDVEDLGILADDPNAIAAALIAAASGHDLVVTSGGVSMGDKDHVKAALDQHGSLVFWRLAIKPGRPVAMGVVDGTPLIGLPGNPVAAFITFIYVLKPLIAALGGASFEPPRACAVTAGFALRKKAGHREYVRAILRRDAQGRMIAEKYPRAGSANLPSLTRTQGLVELREEVTQVAPGDGVSFFDYDLIR